MVPSIMKASAIKGATIAIAVDGRLAIGTRRFVAAEPPDDTDVRAILLRAARRVIALMHRFFADDEHRRPRGASTPPRPRQRCSPAPSGARRYRPSSRGSRSTLRPGSWPATVEAGGGSGRTALAARSPSRGSPRCLTDALPAT
jgi:hypothetical protein